MTAPSRQPSSAPGPIAGTHWRHGLAVLLLLTISAYIDMATGYEVSVFLLYMLPVALATRWMGTPSGILTAVLATALWAWADHSSGHQYSHPWFLYVNALNRMVCFMLPVAVIRYIQTRRHAAQERWQTLTGDMSVCNTCHRVGASDGYWRPFESYLTEVAKADVHHKVCPDCARRQYARAAYRSQSEQVG